MHRLTCASLIAILVTGCHVGAKLKGPSFRLGGDSSAPPPPAASSSSSASASAPAAPGGCYQEFGQDAPNTRDRAMPIEPGTFDGCTGTGDEDWFSIQAPASTPAVLYRITVTVHEMGDDSDPYLLIYDGEGQRLLSEDEYNKPTLEAWVVVAGGTPFVFRAEDDNNGPYTVAIAEVPLSDPDEPNDTREQATPLPLGKPHSALFASAGADMDQATDWYALDIPRSGTLHVDVIDAGVDVEIYATIFNQDREKIDYAYAANKGANFRRDLRIPAPGRYLLAIHNDHSAAPAPAAGEGEPPLRLTKPYTITATLK